MAYKGFMLIEILVVMGLVALLYTLAMPLISFQYHLLARSELNALYACCKNAQCRAMATSTRQKISFDLGNNAYSYDGAVHRLHFPLEFGFINSAYGPPSSASHAISSTITFQNQCISFSEHGIIQPGTVYIKNNYNKTMYALSSAVAHVSYLRKYFYDGAWHAL